MTSRSEQLHGRTDGWQGVGQGAEQALVASLVLGHIDPRELTGRLQREDFFDPAAGVIFQTVVDAAAGGRRVDPSTLPTMLRAAGELRSDGYPIRPLLDWLPTVSVPAHPRAWAGLVVAGSLTRHVDAAGVRLQQASNGYRDLLWGAGRVLAVAAGQRATVHQALVRWEGLPGSWRHAVSTKLQPISSSYPSRPPAPATRDEQLLERELLAGIVAAPAVLDQVRWLQPRDFTDPGCADLFSVVRQLHLEGRPIDLVTLSASLPTSPFAARALDTLPASTGLPSESLIEPDSPAIRVCRELELHLAHPQMVPWMARQQLESSLLRMADATGQDLVAFASAPTSFGGVGGPVLRAALARLDDFTDDGRRLELAQRVAPSSDDARTEPSTLSRLRSLQPDPGLHRDGSGGRDDPGPEHLDRTAG